MSDVSVGAKSIEKRSKNIVTEDAEVSADNNKVLTESAAGYKDRNKDSAYFEDTESFQSLDNECLPKKILSIIDPSHQSLESYSYTFTVSASETEVSTTVVDSISQKSPESSLHSETSVEQERIRVDKIPSGEGTPSNCFEVLDDSTSVSRLWDISSSSESLPHLSERSAKQDIVCVAEVHRADVSEPDDISQDLDVTDESVSVPDGERINTNTVNPEVNKSASNLPKCDWFLPSPVSPYYAGVCERHLDEDINDQSRCDTSLSRINCLVLRLLCFLSDVEHIDSWLRYNIERPCLDLQTLSQSDVISLTDTKHDPEWDLPDRRWPWYHNKQLLIHLRPIDDQLLQTGDSYLCVQARRKVPPGTELNANQDTPVTEDPLDVDLYRLCLMLYTKDINAQSCYPLWECDYAQLFNMDFVHNVTMTNPDDLAEILKHCLIAVETCTRRLTFKKAQTPCQWCRERSQDTICYHSGSLQDSEDNRNNNYEESVVQPRILPAYDKYKEEPPGDSPTLACDQTDSSSAHTTTGDSRNTLSDSQLRCSLSSISHDSDSSPRQQSQKQEARAVYQRAPDGSLVKADLPPCVHTVSVPQSIEDIHQEALMSGAVIYPGCRDVRGAAVVIVFCRHPVWRTEYFTSQELAKILLYYHTVPRKDTSDKGLTVIADARGTTPPVLNAFLETLYTVQANQPGAIYISHVLADKVAQSLLFRSPVFRPQVNLRIDLVMSVETLYKFVSPEHLPLELGGYLQNNHVSWVHFRLKLERFLKQCRDVGEQLVHLMQEMSALECLPATAPDASHQVELHKQSVAQALESDSVVSLQEQGRSVLSSLNTHQHDLAKNEDFRSSLHAAEYLYSQVQDTAVKLSNLAKDHLHRLETCNQRHLLETQMSKLLTWLATEGEQILEKHKVIPENIKGIRNQQKDFEKLYFSAMTQLEKGSDLLEEANLLSQTDSASDVACGIPNTSAELKERMTEYAGRLEEVRERIEDTSRCYHMLDKSYEWALSAMKYAANMKVDKLSSAESIENLLHGLEVYKKENPPLSVDTFEVMLDLAKKLENDKLYDQCKTARMRCMETEQLLQERTAKLRQAKERREKGEGEQKAKTKKVVSVVIQNSLSSVPDTGVSPGPSTKAGVPTSPVTPTTPDSSGLSQNFDSSFIEFRSPPGAFANKEMYMSHLMSVLRRRSYAGKPSAPLYSPGVAAFKESVRDMNLWEYEEYLFHEGLITEDMSDRIVAFLPKGLSDSTMRGSRESLRGSIENLNQAAADVSPQEAKSDSLPRDLSASIKEDYRAAGTSICPPPSLNPTLNKHHRPHRKMLKKASSCSLPENNVTETLPSIREQRDIRSISMITASTESLTCMPEEEMQSASSSQPHTTDSTCTPQKDSDPPCTPPITTERKFGWSPVPVNTHLMYRQNRPVTLTSSQSMADLRVTEDQVKRRRILSLILHEMIQTERDYVKSLQFIIENYIPEISRSDVPQTLRGKRSIIFGNIEKIYEFHSLSFLAELEKCQTNPYAVCHAFLKHDQEFFLYALYNKNKPKSDALMAEYGMSFFKKKQVELGDRMDLNSYLLKPVQRMGKYALLLKQIIKECAETDPEYNDLCAALEMVKFQLRHGNDLLAMDCLKDCDVNLQEQGMLLRQDEFLVWQGRKKSLRHVFLFEEMVLFSKTKRTSSGQDLYVYKNSIKTSDLGLTENVADSKHKFEIWFRKRTAGGTFTLQAPTMDVKNAWVKEISMLLWKQAFRNRERRLSEAARMGIGRKPCMDLKPSQHNIQDRFINISLNSSSSSIPRMRNSIAVSSFEHLRNGGKRPHSLISVSSSSSAGSNQSSNSGGVTTQTNAVSLDVVHEDQRVPDVTQKYPYQTETNVDMMDLNTSMVSTSSSMEDACTQTTLKRPPKQKDRPSDGDDTKQIDETHLQLPVDHIQTTDV